MKTKFYDKLENMPVSKTSNSTGWQKNWIEKLDEDAIDWARRNSPAPILEIGAAYGFMTEHFLKTGCQVTSVDLSQEHLDAINENLGCNQLQTIQGQFPSEVDFEPDTFTTIHAGNILHFLTGDDLEFGLKEIFKWLRPGGRVFVDAISPYNKVFAPEIPNYEEKKKNEKWPGVYQSLQSMKDALGDDNIPVTQHFLDHEVLSPVLEDIGFNVLFADFFEPRFAWKEASLDGREKLAVIAEKPKS